MRFIKFTFWTINAVFVVIVQQLYSTRLLQLALKDPVVEEILENAKKERMTVRAPPFSHEESFGACLLIMDQNHRITEWIAYHFFALPLRTLVIAYDPRSTDRASDLVKRWKDVIDIIEWEENDYLPINWTSSLRYKGGTAVHKHRQPRFMAACNQLMHSKNVSRVVHADVDEYMRVGTQLVTSNHVDEKKPGHITALLNRLEDVNNTLLLTHNNTAYNTICSIFPRLQYTPLVENTPDELQQNVTKLVDPVHFNTLRYCYRNKWLMDKGKGFINLQRVPVRVWEQIDRWSRVHSPLGNLCKESWKEPIFVFNHYPGSFESYQYAHRNDPRFNASDKDHWTKRAYGGKADPKRNVPLLEDSITSWVPAFFDWQSEEVASDLLRDTGMRSVLSESLVE